MQPDVIERLRSLNRGFYQSFGDSFAATRTRVQPGVAQVMAHTASDARILDLGCGHGHLADFLTRNGHHGDYLGVDSSQALLALARENVEHPAARFLQADLQLPDWTDSINGSFDIVTAFAVLHHIAGQDARRSLLQGVHDHLTSDGYFIFSCWNFLASDRLRSRIQSWSAIGIKAEDVDPGDYLLDWRAGGLGYRYVHHYEESELEGLAEDTGFSVQRTLYADGASGNLGLYQVWQPSSPGAKSSEL